MDSSGNILVVKIFVGNTLDLLWICFWVCKLSASHLVKPQPFEGLDALEVRAAGKAADTLGAQSGRE